MEALWKHAEAHAVNYRLAFLTLSPAENLRVIPHCTTLGIVRKVKEFLHLSLDTVGVTGSIPPLSRPPSFQYVAPSSSTVRKTLATT
jgi:hypothetical protein